MNIFVLDSDPQIAATMMCDKHVVKMVVETAQMLCTVASEKGYDMPYRPTHRNHPCTKWASKSRGNWRWLIDHGMSLCGEYTKRYGRRHKSQSVIEMAKGMKLAFDSDELTSFAQAMPDKYRNECAVKAYRDYYMGEKAKMATWKTQPPKWWKG